MKWVCVYESDGIPHRRGDEPMNLERLNKIKLLTIKNNRTI